MVIVMSERKNAARRAARGYTSPKPKGDRSMVAGMKAAHKLIQSLPQQAIDRFEAEFKDMAPAEVSKVLAARMLADEVREHFRANIPNRLLTDEDRAHFKEVGFDPPLGTMVHDLADFTNSDNVVEFLEHAVEGDAIIDSAEVSAWMRKKLGEYRDQCIKFDDMADEMNAVAVICNLRTAMATYDILVQVGGNTCMLFANEKGRAAFDPEKEVEWNQERDGFFPGDWLIGPCAETVDGKLMSVTKVKNAALTIAQEMPGDIRIGFIANKWARAEAVTPQAEAA
jgi:hypothetical protein